MKHFIVLILALFCGTAYGDTINLSFMNDDNTSYQNSSCTVGGDLILPNPPTKTGYNFVGWKIKSAKELEYVTFQNNGFSYIDTGIKFDSDEIEYELKASVGHTYRVIFAVEGTCSNQYGAQGIQTDGANRPRFYAGGTQISTTLIANSVNTYNFYVKKSTNTFTVTINDGPAISRNLTGTIPSDKNIRIGNNNSDNIGYCHFYGDMYYFRIKKDGVLVLDLIPAKDPDGVVCFYDRVSKTFFYNQYGADLVAGPEVQ